MFSALLLHLPWLLDLACKSWLGNVYIIPSEMAEAELTVNGNHHADTRSNIFNTLKPRQNCRQFADEIFKCILVNENCCILITISLKYVCKGASDNNRALVHELHDWCQLWHPAILYVMNMRIRIEHTHINIWSCNMTAFKSHSPLVTAYFPKTTWKYFM